MAGPPLAAAIALGAVVAPPDAAAAQAVLGRLGLPRRTLVILQGESLFNDAIALLLFGGAVTLAQGTGHPLRALTGVLLQVPGGVLLGAVVAVRVLWVMLYPLLLRPLLPDDGPQVHGQTRVRLVVSWAGMRGVLTMATALSLPGDFPGRELIVLCALAVVLGTVVLQGATLDPLIRWLKIPADTTTARAIGQARQRLEAAGREEQLERLAAGGTNPDALRRVRDWYHAQPAPGEIQAKRRLVQAERRQRNALHTGELPEDAFRILQEELDLRELSLTEPEARKIEGV